MFVPLFDSNYVRCALKYLDDFPNDGASSCRDYILDMTAIVSVSHNAFLLAEHKL